MTERLITKQAVRQVLQDYWRQYKSRPWRTVLAFLFPALGNILVFFVPPLIIGRLVNVFVENNEISLALSGGHIAILGASWMLGEFFWRFGADFLIKLETEGNRVLGKLAFSRLTERDYDFFANNFVGTLAKKASSFSRSFEIFTDTLFFNIFTNIFPLIFVMVVLWFYSPWIPLILLSCMTAVMLIAIPIIRRRSKMVAARHDAGSKVVGRLSDSLTNMAAVKSFAKENEERRVYGEYVDDYAVKFKKAGDYHNINLEGLISPIYVITNIIGLIAAIFFAHKLGLQAGTVVVVFSYYSQITRIFWEISRIYRNIESSISEAAEFTQLFIDPPKVQDAEDAEELKIKKAEIKFEHVNFGYANENEDEESFLNDFNLTIEGNQKVGLVGPSGGGKTTITKLILRFIDLQSGSISIDGQDISQVTQKSLREQIAYVPQEPLLFHRSLLENIAYGNEKATESEVAKAAKIAHADDFIRQLPQGYQTLVGERGIKLSGGQRQRIAIARALLKKSSILVLDEATSSLDSESEKYIQDGLLKLMKNKTALVIAHRLSTIKHLDRILVLDKGRIVQDGTHEELIRQKGIYAKLWSHQSGEFL